MIAAVGAGPLINGRFGGPGWVMLIQDCRLAARLEKLPAGYRRAAAAASAAGSGAGGGASKGAGSRVMTINILGANWSGRWLEIKGIKYWS